MLSMHSCHSTSKVTRWCKFWLRILVSNLFPRTYQAYTKRHVVTHISHNSRLSSHHHGVIFPCRDMFNISLCTQLTLIHVLLPGDNANTLHSGHTMYLSRVDLTMNSVSFPVQHKRLVLWWSRNAFSAKYELNSCIPCTSNTIYCILASCYIRLTLNICSFVHQCNTFTSYIL
jgi:hypothetical protein